MPTARQQAPKLEDVTDGKQPTDGKAEAQEEARAEAAKKNVPVPPALPRTKTVSSGDLVDKMTVIHGPPGVGKSTLASQWAGGDIFFFNVAGELGELEVYQQPIMDWEE